MVRAFVGDSTIMSDLAMKTPVRYESLPLIRIKYTKSVQLFDDYARM
jgi:hypothetical protein